MNRFILVLLLMAGTIVTKADAVTPTYEFLVPIPLSYVPDHIDFSEHPPFSGQHKTPPATPVRLSFDGENKAMEITACQSCMFTLIIGGNNDSVVLEETFCMSNSEQTIIILPNMTAGIYNVSIQIGNALYTGNIEM